MQPDPIPNQEAESWELVVEDMQARNAFGKAKYGTPLQPHNGRDSLQDAYEEALDLSVYLKNAIEEMRGCPPKLRAMARKLGWDKALERWPRRDEYCECGFKAMQGKDVCHACRKRDHYTRCQ